MTTNPRRNPISAPAILCVLCLGLGAAVVYRQSTSATEKKRYQAALGALSNEVQEASAKLHEQKQVNLSLERDVATLSGDLKDKSKRVEIVPNSASKSDLRERPASESVQLPDPRLVELESERDDLTGQLESLTGSMSSLQSQMVETQRKLQTSEGDRELLLSELKRLQAETIKLQRQFNDLAQLRQQMRKLRAEQSVSRRLEWARRGSDANLKGGELLQKRLASVTRPPSDYRLDVEVRRDGAMGVGAKPVE